MHFALFLKGFIEVNKTNFFGRLEPDFKVATNLKKSVKMHMPTNSTLIV